MTQLPFEDLPEQPDTTFDVFENEFWGQYPRRVGKRKARAAFDKALKRAPLEKIIKGLQRYQANKPAYCDWMHPTTFLNGDHWEDEYDNGHAIAGPPGSIEALTIIAAHAKQPWCERGKYTRDVLQRCVDAELLTQEEAEDKS